MAISTFDFKVNCSDGDGDRFAYEIFTKGCYDLALANWVFLDIGAHVGVFSMYVHKFAKQIFAIEPNPVNYKNLLKNIEENKLERVIPFNCALWKDTGHHKFVQNTSSGGGGILDQSGETQTYTLKDFVDKFNVPQIDVVKCDVEGAEDHIFCDTSSAAILANAKAVTFEHGSERSIRVLESIGFKVVGEGGVTTLCKT